MSSVIDGLPAPQRGTLPWLLVVALLGASGAALAQDEDAMSLDDAEASAFSWFLDGQARYERTSTIPARTDDVHRTRYRLRAGVLWNSASGFELGAAVKGQIASSDNIDTRRNNDNEQSDDTRVDQLFARYTPSDSLSLTLGKTELPLELSPLLWDADLRPIGASARLDVASGDFNNWHFNLGYFEPDHLYDDDSRLAALQIAYGWHEGADTSASVIASYLDFSSLDALIDGGLGRTNRRANNPAAGRIQFISDYQLLDVQLVGRTTVWEGRPLEVRLDYVKNLGADDLDTAARGSVQLGDARLGGWEVGFAYQRMQRDAVVAAFSEDDWWFHSFARGGMPWLGYGFSEHWRMRLAGFKERRDGIADATDRVLLDVNTNW